MARRRQSEVLRNLDDSLRVMGLLTMRSCGLVVVFYCLCYALELALGLWSLLFGIWGFVAQLAATLCVAAALSWVERHDDEHYVPSAIRYALSRPWRGVHGAGIVGTAVPSRAADVLRAARRRAEDGL